MAISLVNNTQRPKTIVGVIERITYNNPETGYTIARTTISNEPDPVTVIGRFSTITSGEVLRMTGFWVNHHRYGAQFNVTSYETCKPATLAGIEKYLGSGLIKGIGPVTAKRIVAYFKEETLNIIEKNIHQLEEVPGIARKRVEMISRAWLEQQAIKEVMLFLQSHGVTTHFAVKIFKEYGPRAIQTVSENPYRLEQDIYGIGFKTADQIAHNIGIKEDSEERIRAGLRHVLSKAVEKGHCFLIKNSLVTETLSLLELKEDILIAEVAEQMAAEGELKAEINIIESSEEFDQLNGQPLYYLPALWQSEQNVVNLLQGLLIHKNHSINESLIDTSISSIVQKHGLELSSEQRKAILCATQQNILVLTGGPGCGKTTTLRTMVELFQSLGKQVELASPTGRAAQRLSEVTGVQARTLHRMLAFDPVHRAFKNNSENPLDTDVVIVDEASMLDIILTGHLLKAIPPNGQLILVGDVDQLPSVGPGRVLGDIINSGVVPVVRLTEIFRQAQNSLIIKNAHKIRDGQFPYLVKPDGMVSTDCYFLEADEPEEVHKLLLNTVTRSLPKKFGYDPIKDIQVLTPMNRGSLGASELNRQLQEHLNSPSSTKNQIERGIRFFREGDKVIQQVNNYNLEVFNGDIGFIRTISTEDQIITIDFADRAVNYDWADINELGHGFAISVHKSQGSEYPATVVILHSQAWPILSRNLLYTALTRAKQVAVIIGNKMAIGAAMKKAEAEKRNTRLMQNLKNLTSKK